MKRKKLLTTLALALSLTAAFILGTQAATGVQNITAQLNSNIAVVLDGEAQTLVDANGTRVYPIIYRNSTYLPVRAVSELVGLDVVWDGATQSVLLGKQPSGVDLIDTYNIYNTTKGHWECNPGQVKTADGKTEEIAGITKNHWLYLNCAWGTTTSASYNLQGKHSTLTFSYYSPSDVTLNLFGDDEALLGSYTITGGAAPKTVTLPLLGTNELTFQAVPDGGWPAVRVFDARLDAEE